MLNFRKFLVEMETTQDQKDRLRTIIQKTISGDRQWLKEKVISAKDKGEYFVLNYAQGERNEYNELVRGLVVQKPQLGWNGDVLSLIKSFPFIRFFNAHEKEAAPIDFANSKMIEKLDGSLVCIWFPTKDPNNPQYNTRKMLSTHQPDMNLMVGGFHDGKTFPFMKVIGQYVKQLKFNPEDVEMTYIFEFIHEASKVLTKYSSEKYGLHLIGARNIRTHRELTEDELNVVAQRIGAPRPRSWDSSGDEETIRKMMDEIEKGTKDFEGMVFRDKTGNRVKLKRADYIKLHHLLGSLSFKNLIPKILDGEIEEVLAYFPSGRKKVDEFNEIFGDYVDNAVATILKYSRQKLDRKSIALKVFGGEVDNQFLKSLIMRNFELTDENVIRETVINALKEVALGKNKNEGSPKRLMEILGLEDDEDEASDVGEI
jgi:predicted RNA-binding protein with EMAP domain